MDSTRLLLPLLPWEFDIFLVGSPLNECVDSETFTQWDFMQKMCCTLFMGNLLKHQHQ